MRDREVRALIRKAPTGYPLDSGERLHAKFWPPVWEMRFHGERFSCVSNEVARMFYALCLEATQ